MAMVSAARVGAGRRSVPPGRALSPHVSPSGTPYVQRGVPGPSAGILGRSELCRGRRGRAGPGRHSGVSAGSSPAPASPCGTRGSEGWDTGTSEGMGKQGLGEGRGGMEGGERGEKDGKCLRMN